MGKQIVEVFVKRDQYENGKFYHTANIIIYDTEKTNKNQVKMVPLEHIENLKIQSKNISNLTHISYVEYNKKRYYFPYIKSSVGEGIYTCIKVEPVNWFKRLCWRLLKIDILW